MEIRHGEGCVGEQVKNRRGIVQAHHGLNKCSTTLLDNQHGHLSVDIKKRYRLFPTFPMCIHTHQLLEDPTNQFHNARFLLYWTLHGTHDCFNFANTMRANYWQGI